MSPHTPVVTAAEDGSRVARLEACFEAVARERMAGVPLLHPGLRVQAIGFERPARGRGDWLEGVLLTPWFMNLVRLPLRVQPAGQGDWLAAGQSAPRDFGAQAFDFIGAQEVGVGGFEAASLFSPVLDFADQRAAVATAQAALDLLRGRPVAGRAASTGAATGPVPAVQPPDARPARRGFLFGRG